MRWGSCRFSIISVLLYWSELLFRIVYGATLCHIEIVHKIARRYSNNCNVGQYNYGYEYLASLNPVWHVRGSFQYHYNLARVRADVFVIKVRLANEGLIEARDDCSATYALCPEDTVRGMLSFSRRSTYVPLPIVRMQEPHSRLA